MMARAELPVIHVGRSVRVPKAALLTWLEARTEFRAALHQGRSDGHSAAVTGRSRPARALSTAIAGIAEQDHEFRNMGFTSPGQRPIRIEEAIAIDARRMKTNFLPSSLDTDDTSTCITVGRFLDKWLATVVQPSVRRWTYVGYETYVRLHLKPRIGQTPLDRLAPAEVQEMLNGLRAAGLAPKTVRHIRGVLRASLNCALRWGLVSHNVATLVELPQARPFDIKPLTPEESRIFLRAIVGERLEALYSIALTMGLRQGEALGLRWLDVDFDRGVLRVEKQLQRVDHRLQLVELKTERSRRTIVMPNSIAGCLHVHRKSQEEERSSKRADWNSLGLVFVRNDGNPLEGTTVGREFHRLLDVAGLGQRRFHDLRHTCATLLMVQGVSARVVMEILGHSDVSMTLNTYSHVIPELQHEAAYRMDDLLDPYDWRGVPALLPSGHVLPG
jgi:integrase